MSILENNLIKSLKGCPTPDNKILLGPTRAWIYPKIFRSNSVKNATEIKIVIRKKIMYVNVICEKETLSLNLKSNAKSFFTYSKLMAILNPKFKKN